MPQKVVLSKQVSSVILSSLSPKKKNLGALHISCTIGDINFYQALSNLGAFINLIPTTLYRQFGFGELKPTHVTLQLVDRSVKTLKGVVGDVILRVKNFYFPIDFVILDIEVPERLKDTLNILG
jgi:hypothetical protein